jgi:hypothetical protein
LEIPYFDRQSLNFSARRLRRGIQLSASFNAPQLSSGRPVRYVADITVDPKTRAVIGVQFSYSRDGSKYLASHGRSTDELRRFAYQIGDIFLASPAWIELKDRSPDPYYIVDRVGKVTVRVPTALKLELLRESDDEAEG